MYETCYGHFVQRVCEGLMESASMRVASYVGDLDIGSVPKRDTEGERERRRQYPRQHGCKKLLNKIGRI